MSKLVLQSSTLGTAEAGAFQYDGKVPYFTPQGLERGIVPGMQYYVTNSTIVGANSTATQNILGVGVTLSSNTFYAFEGNFNFFKTAGTTSHVFNFRWGGTATFDRIITNMLVQTSTQGYVTVSADRNARQYTLETVGPFGVATINTAFYTVNIQIRGIAKVNTGGTFIPQYSLSAAPGGAYNASTSNNMSIWPLGDTSDNISVGTWA